MANIDDEASGNLAVTGVAQEGATLTASLSNVSDLDGATTTAYQWQYRSGAGTQADPYVRTDLSGATSASYTLASEQSQVGLVLRVVATTTDALGGTTEFVGNAATVANVNDAPTGSVSITGTATQGQTLTASNTLADADGLGTLAYQWKADGAVISGATASTYTLTQAEVGKTITVTASYTDGFGVAESVDSRATDLVAFNAIEAVVQSYLWKSHSLLLGVELSANDQSGVYQSGVSDALGQASLQLPPDASFTMQVSGNLGTTEQSQADAAVNLSDAIAILKMIVGLDVNPAGQPLSPYQALAADFNGNGKVELSDAIGVLKHVVGLDSPEPVLQFVDEASPEVADITNSPVAPGQAPAVVLDTSEAGATMHVGLVVYLRGDVDGSYSGPTGSASLPASYFVELANTTGLSLSQFGVYN